MTIDPRAVVAANNNADLYEAVFSAHQAHYERLPHAFVAIDQPPPYYSHFTILTDDHAEKVSQSFMKVMERFSGDAGMKDSFCQTSEVANNLRVLFGASWIWRDVQSAAPREGWSRVTSADDLQLWEQAWKLNGSPTDVRMFNERFLAREDIFVFGQKRDGVYVSGCIGNLSNDCIGISNIFSAGDGKQAAREAVAAVGSIAPDLPMVGYEAGEELDTMRGLGFEVVGQLRILVPAS